MNILFESGSSVNIIIIISCISYHYHRRP